MKTETAPKQTVVVFTGAGISAESGIQTFRDGDGLWNKYSIADLATPEAWSKDPALVLSFYNARRRIVGQAFPNAAHQALKRLETMFDVIVVTQNVDDLHERAGSSFILHLHGEITKARSSVDDGLTYEIGYRDILVGETCSKHSQLRPHIVWFGETVLNFDRAAHYMRVADRVMVIGTSLIVEPAASLLKLAKYDAVKVLISPEIAKRPFGFRVIHDKATIAVPAVVEEWLREIEPQ